MSNRKDIFVFADWTPNQTPAPIGTLHAETVRGKETLSFEYAEDWLESGEPILLDPKLHFGPGPQFSQTPFGLFLDSAPDRWGRVLIQRREALRAKEDKRPVRALSDSDYLLEVHDLCRMGALRFKTEPDGPFISNDDALSAPPLHSLRELEQASLHLEESDPNSLEYQKWLRQILAPGSSLGGARPKANVTDPDGNLWIAKFPGRGDEFNVGAWEAVVYHLARKAGLHTVPARTEKLSAFGDTFLSKRFDRNGSRRIHFASAINLLGYQDGDNAKTGVSYLDLVDLIEQISEQPNDDLKELWRRIVFSICVCNTDDHLRNHGFLLGTQGWKLSPVYDLNPQPDGGGLSLNISETDNALDLDTALDVSKYFRLSSTQADALIKEVSDAVKTWETVASHHGINKSEIERMQPAFHTGASL